MSGKDLFYIICIVVLAIFMICYIVDLIIRAYKRHKIRKEFDYYAENLENKINKELEEQGIELRVHLIDRKED